MDSITKISLEKSKLEYLVRNAFGKEAKINKIDEMKDGWFNTLYSISLYDKREIVIKISPPSNIKTLRYEKNIMATEVEVLNLLKMKTNVPVPKVLCYDDTKLIIDYEYFFMEKINGQSYSKIKDSLSEKEKELIDSELGTYNRCINEIRGKKFGYFSQPDKNYAKWSEAFNVMISDILQDGKELDVKLPIDYDEIYELIAKKHEILDLVVEPRLTHWDLHDGNVIVNSDCKITGIIDCDRALWGDPLIEVYFGSFFNNNNFLKGYGCDLIISQETKCRRIMYNLYLYLIMVIESKYRCYDENHEKWTFKMLEEEIILFKTLFK